MEHPGESKCKNNGKGGTDQNYEVPIQFGGRVLGEAGKENRICGPSIDAAGCDPVKDKWWQSSAYLMMPLIICLQNN